MNKKLLLEVYRGSHLPKVAESQDGVPQGCMRVEGVLAVVNEMNRNKRFYPKGMYGQHVTEMQTRIDQNGGILGEMEHPESMTINLANVSHKMENVWIDESNGCVMGKLMLLDTPKGLIAQSIVKSGTPLHISSRAVGTVDENGAVNLDYLSTYDLVGTPGFKQASLHRVSESLSESGTLISESFEYDLDADGHIVKESNSLDLKQISEMIDSKINESIKAIQSTKQEVTEDSVRSIVKSYVSETAAPDIQTYLDGELDSRISEADSSMSKADIIKLMNERFINSYAPTIQKWSINEFAPGIQNWFVNEAAPEIQNWSINEFAPGIQNWSINEFAPGIQNWLVNDFVSSRTSTKASVKESIVDKTQNTASVLEKIDSLIDTAKGLNKSKIVETQESIAKRKLDENFKHAPAWLQYIPEQHKLTWLALSESAKREISRNANVRNFSNQQDIDEFWNTRDFENLTTSKRFTDVKKVHETVHTAPINESQQNNQNGIAAFAQRLR